MKSGEKTIDQSFYPNMSVEFPVIHQDLVGYKTRYTYIAQMTSKTPVTQEAKDSTYFAGFIKFDLQEGKVVKYIPFGDTRSGGEVFFHQKENA